MAVTTSDDYLTRREPHRREHLEGLRAAGILIGGGPAPDGKSADLFYRLQQPRQIKNAMEEDPYFLAAAWTGYTPRSFTQFVEPWEAVPVVLDAGNARPPLCLRVNIRRIAPDDYVAALAAEGHVARRIGVAGVIVDKPRPATARS